MDAALHPEDEAFLAEYSRRHGMGSVEEPLRIAVHLLRLMESAQIEALDDGDGAMLREVAASIDTTPERRVGGREIDESYFNELRARFRDRGNTAARRAQ
ncbi:MAG: hypothetical protein IT303_07365 [Dehalococcoidia bacterium]|nr:hypothetical protein [Dehalococcoidia bacterium]